jgi:starvation-inducible DNA-binding protein
MIGALKLTRGTPPIAPPEDQPMTAPSAAALQASLVELLDLALQGKQAHWNVVGPAFRPVHLELDEIVASAHDAVDTVAERLSALREVPDGRAATVAAQSPFEPFPDGTVIDREAVVLIGARIDLLNANLHERVEGLGADPVSQGILVAIEEALEKHAWMLRVQLA